jgi:hypothetical protein
VEHTRIVDSPLSEITTEGRTLDRITAVARDIEGVWAHEVREGDWVVVRTRNSTYSLASVGNGRYQVVGGWFASEGCDNVRVRVVGCTWGGTAIHTGLVAAPGMFLEFDNGVRTTRIREVRLMRADESCTH